MQSRLGSFVAGPINLPADCHPSAPQARRETRWRSNLPSVTLG